MHTGTSKLRRRNGVLFYTSGPENGMGGGSRMKGRYIATRGLVWRGGDETYAAATGCGNSRRPATFFSFPAQRPYIYTHKCIQYVCVRIHVYIRVSIHRYTRTQRAGFEPRQVDTRTRDPASHSGRADCEKIFPLKFINKRMREEKPRASAPARRAFGGAQFFF